MKTKQTTQEPKPAMRDFLCPLPAEHYAALQKLAFERTEIAVGKGKKRVAMTDLVRDAVAAYLKKTGRG